MQNHLKESCDLLLHCRWLGSSILRDVIGSSTLLASSLIVIKTQMILELVLKCSILMNSKLMGGDAGLKMIVR